MWKSVLITTCVCWLAACTNFNADDDTIVPKMIVEGWIENGGFPVVMLTRSLPVSSEYQQIDNLSDYIIRWAKVSISDGKNSYVLTGKFDKGYFPPYIYTTSRMRGEVGKTYTITVEFRDMYATASTRIPPPPDNCSFRVEKTSESDKLFQIKAHFVDVPTEKNYYQFFTRVGTTSKQYLASYLGSVDDAVLNGETEMVVMKGHRLDEKDYSPYFTIDDTVSVKFAQVEETSYRIWDSYTKLLSLSSNMFLSTSSNIETNIIGGYGYWCGYGVITDHIVIKDSVSLLTPIVILQ